MISTNALSRRYKLKLGLTLPVDLLLHHKQLAHLELQSPNNVIKALDLL